MVLLAHIRDQHRFSLGSYGRPRRAEEPNEPGLRVGHRRVLWGLCPSAGGSKIRHSSGQCHCCPPHHRQYGRSALFRVSDWGFLLCLFQRRGPEIAAGNARSGVNVGLDSRGEA